MVHHTVREYARLSAGQGASTLERTFIGRSAFDWLINARSHLQAGGAELLQVENNQWLRLDNYVGLIETPCGTQIEILPKTLEDASDVARTRALLLRMIATAYDLPTRTFGDANLQSARSPLLAWMVRRFLDELEILIRRGLRSTYEATSSEEPFLRGRLDLRRQTDKPPWRLHQFSVTLDELSLQTPENALLRSALDLLSTERFLPIELQLTVQEFASRLSPIQASRDIRRDLALWRTDRLMSHYRSIQPLCRLILLHLNPLAPVGRDRGMSLLFPMEEVFERYVAKVLRRQLPKGARLREQARYRSLCEYEGRPIFELRPDLITEIDDEKWVLDTKWKRANETRSDRFGVSQSDMYQMFAYGHRYQEGRGDVFLVYPKTRAYAQPVGPLKFSAGLSCYLVPFDLERDELAIPPSCELSTHLARSSRVLVDAAIS